MKKTTTAERFYYDKTKFGEPLTTPSEILTDFAKLHIEALREKLKEGIEIKFEDEYNGSNGNSSGMLYSKIAMLDTDSIDQVINDYLNQLK